MTAKGQKILNDALEFSEEERAKLAASLISSLDGSGVDPDIEDAWRLEIDRRVQELDSGKTKTVLIDVNYFCRRRTTILAGPSLRKCPPAATTLAGSCRSGLVAPGL